MNITHYTIQELQTVPVLSEDTVKYLNEPSLGPVNISVIADRLKKLSSDLEYVQKHPIGNVVSAITRSILTAGIVAAGVAGVLFTGYPVICGVAAGVLYMLASGENAALNGVNIRFNIWDLGLLVVGGPFFPLAGLINKEQKLKDITRSHTILADVHLNQRKKVFSQDLSATIKNLEIQLKASHPDADKVIQTDKILKEIKENVAFFTKV